MFGDKANGEHKLCCKEFNSQHFIPERLLRDSDMFLFKSSW